LFLVLLDDEVDTASSLDDVLTALFDDDETVVIDDSLDENVFVLLDDDAEAFADSLDENVLALLDDDTEAIADLLDDDESVVVEGLLDENVLDLLDVDAVNVAGSLATPIFDAASLLVEALWEDSLITEEFKSTPLPPAHPEIKRIQKSKSNLFIMLCLHYWLHNQAVPSVHYLA
jgi:hypothetical protein